ncbi:MAG: protein-disulfide isomerase [Alphaproteobacteria bacterium]|jgi:protein-disulfide isomerase
MALALTILAPAFLSAPAAAQQKAVSAEQRSAMESVIRDYLLKNPAIIRDAMQRLQAQEEAAKAAAAATALKDHRNELLHDASSPVGGNPAGDVTIVEFFDYNCSYCKRVAPTVKALIKSDPNIRVVYKEFAILGPPSVLAAKAALAAQRQGKYVPFHGALMSSGRATDSTIAALAKNLGMDYGKLLKDMKDPAISKTLQRTYRLAGLLGINGTPAFIIGNQLVPGAISADALARMVRAERARLKAASARK